MPQDVRLAKHIRRLFAGNAGWQRKRDNGRRQRQRVQRSHWKGMKCTLAWARTFLKNIPCQGVRRVARARNVFPERLKVGRFIFLNGRHATGWQRKREQKRSTCLSKGPSKRGSGPNLPPLSGGLPMANGAMALPYGNWLLCHSRLGRRTQTTDDGKCGVKGWRWR